MIELTKIIHYKNSSTKTIQKFADVSQMKCYLKLNYGKYLVLENKNRKLVLQEENIKERIVFTW